MCVAGDREGNIAVSLDPTATGTWSLTTPAPAFALESVSCPSAYLCVGADSEGDVLTGGIPTCSPVIGYPSCITGASASISGGDLSVEAPESLSWAGTLTGSALSLDSALPLIAIDATGSGAGWQLTLSATTFSSTGTTPCTPAQPCTLPDHDALTLDGSSLSPASGTPSVGCLTGSTCVAPAGDVTYPLEMSTDAASAIVIADAAAGSGMGAISMSGDLWLSVPADADAGTYNDTITVAIASGP